jgi:GNAT superfamily N-acetyltransferase
MDAGKFAARVGAGGEEVCLQECALRADVVLRSAVPEDAAACAAILNGWIDATEWVPRVHGPDDVARYYRDHVLATCEVTVAERSGAIAGFLALGADGFVSALYLAPEARGRGIGAALVAVAKARCPGGLTLWTFVANGPARRFYARQGFAEVRRTDGDNEERLPDVLLAWRGPG